MMTYQTQIYVKLIGSPIDAAYLPQHEALGVIKDFKNVPAQSLNVRLQKPAGVVSADLQQYLDFLEVHHEAIKSARVDKIIIYLTIFCPCGAQCNSEYSSATLQRLANLKASLAITYANPV